MKWNVSVNFNIFNDDVIFSSIWPVSEEIDANVICYVAALELITIELHKTIV